MIMDCLEKLKKIGIKKINQETRISVGVLENILEKRFDKIQRVWVVGFLPILERHYDVDLSEWLQEYDAYHLENQDSKSAGAYKIRELELDTQQRHDYFQNFFQRLDLRKALISLVILLVILLVIFIYKLITDSRSQSGMETEEQHVTVETSEQPKTNDIYSQLNTQNVQEKEPEPLALPPLPAPKDGEIMITPKGELWFQVYNPQTKEKQDHTIKDAYIMQVPKDGTFIIFGHKGFSLVYVNGSKNYDGGGPIRFIVENGRLKYIKYSDYIKKLGITQPKKDFQGSADTPPEDSQDGHSTDGRSTQDDKSTQNTQENQNAQPEVESKTPQDAPENTQNPDTQNQDTQEQENNNPSSTSQQEGN